ncbi:MAG: hypothetical protein ABR923_14890 [Terracidiphilus sp.]|jgi:hypothetical protein
MRNRLYNRTQNDNGSYNTRCLHCFMTVASCVETEQELADLETRHICPERALAELLDHAKDQEKQLVAKSQLN